MTMDAFTEWFESRKPETPENKVQDTLAEAIETGQSFGDAIKKLAAEEAASRIFEQFAMPLVREAFIAGMEHALNMANNTTLDCGLPAPMSNTYKRELRAEIQGYQPRPGYGIDVPPGDE